MGEARTRRIPAGMNDMTLAMGASRIEQGQACDQAAARNRTGPWERDLRCSRARNIDRRYRRDGTFMSD